jgi:hypothetical protein
MPSSMTSLPGKTLDCLWSLEEGLHQKPSRISQSRNVEGHSAGR